jgi:hypothetical protein
MKRKLTFVFVAALTAHLTCVANAVFTIRKASGSLPVIDGVVTAHEYEEGLRLAGFLSVSGGRVLSPGNEGFATFLSDGTTLFVAWRVKARNIDIGGGLKAKATVRDGAVWDDDGVELVVESEDSPVRVAHFIFNPNGIIYDSLSEGGRKADVKWNCPGLKVASKVLQGWWEIEAAIPLKDIGKFEKGVSVNAARSVPGQGAASLTASTDYIRGPKIRLEWLENASAVAIESLGTPAEGEWRPEIAMTSGAADARVRADILLREMKEDGSPGSTLLVEGKTLRAGESLAAAFDTRSRALIRAELTARDAKTGAVLMEHVFDARRGARSAGVPPSAEFDLGTLGEVAVYHYPGLQRIRFTLHPAPGSGITTVRCTLDGHSVQLEKQGGAFTAIAPTPTKPGKYPVAFTVRCNDAEQEFKAAWTLDKRVFEWEGNSIGKDKIILPPFKPITAEGNTLSVVLRKYTIGAAGLPESIIALGKEILAAPAYYEAVVEGKRMRFTGGAPQIEIQDNGYAATVVARATAEGLALESVGHFEYDGFLWNEVTLKGLKGRNIERLSLVVTLKNEEAPLMHICTTDSIRHNPTGAVPPGEGVVWDGTKLYRKSGFVEDMFAPQVVPYVWLGAERRGLCWFVNNTSGMRLAADNPSVRIVRRQGALLLEIDFVNEPSRLEEGHTLAFGFEATPVKETDKAMRQHFQTGPGDHPEGMIARHAVSFHATGFWNGWARRPYGDEWELFKLACERVNTAGAKAEYVAAYTAFTNKNDAELEVYASKLPDIGKQTHFDWILSCRDYAFQRILNIEKPGYPFKYSDPTLTWNREEAEEYYKAEWISRSTGYIGATRNFITPSYLNYILYYHKKEIDLGMKGIYFDDMFPMTCRNPDTCMQMDSEGRWHGNFGILEMRELVKRAAVMQHLAGVKPRLMQIHMTNCLLIPSFAFATSMLSWEDHFGEEIFQKRFAVDYMRAESLGTQIGAEAVALDGIQRRQYDEKEWRAHRFRFITRTQQALLLPAGVKIWLRPAIPGNGVDRKELFKILEVLSRFEVWAEDCEFKAFFEDDNAVSGAPQEVLVGTYRRPGKTLAIFGDSGGQDVEFGIKADAAKLGLKAPFVFTDGESGEQLPDGKVKLPAWDLRLVLITEKK